MKARTRIACCACRRLQLTVEGEPTFVSACNCTECQRRTGSVYGVGAYFTGAQVISLVGETRSFTRISDGGRPVQFHFCPNCGSSVYWTGLDRPVSEGVGIAVGCFADPAFPAPQLIAWCASAHGWVAFPPGIARHDTQPDQVAELY